MALSKTAAIREARGFVGLPIRRSATDYVVYGPWDDGDPHGPSTEFQADSYPKAIAARTRWVARIALALMGRLDGDAKSTIEYESDRGYGSRVEDLVNAALAG